MEYCLRKAQQSDLEFLLDLREATMGGYIRQLGMSTSKEAYLSRIYYEFEAAQIVEVDGIAAGLFKAKYTPENNEWYLVQIQIHSNYQNNQLASRLITALIERADATQAHIGLSVLKNNPAQHLYLRLGFVQIDENDHEYIMQRRYSSPH